MAYPYTHYRQRLAQGEELTGKDLHDEQHDNEMQAIRSARIVYVVVVVMMALVIARIILRLAGMDGALPGVIVHGFTDPYVWIFNSLFSSSPYLLLSRVEPGALVSLAFFPLFGWALRGLIYEIYRGRYYFMSLSRARRQ